VLRGPRSAKKAGVGGGSAVYFENFRGLI